MFTSFEKIYKYLIWKKNIEFRRVAKNIIPFPSQPYAQKKTLFLFMKIFLFLKIFQTNIAVQIISIFCTWLFSKSPIKTFYFWKKNENKKLFFHSKISLSFGKNYFKNQEMIYWKIIVIYCNEFWKYFIYDNKSQFNFRCWRSAINLKDNIFIIIKPNWSRICAS